MTGLCRRGHALTPDNVYMRSSGVSRCRACHNEAQRNKRREAAAAKGISCVAPSDRTHCPKGHPYSGENLVLQRGGRARVCRVCMRERHRRHDREGGVTKATVARIFDALHSGATISAITIGRVGGRRVPRTRIVTYGKLQTLKRLHPKIGRRIEALASKNEGIARLKAVTARRHSAHKLLTSDGGAGAFTLIAWATSGLPDYLRDDVRSEMLLAVAEGRLNPRDSRERLREFVLAHNRMFSKFVPGAGLMMSLDQNVYDDGPATLKDVVTRGMWQPDELVIMEDSP